MISLLVIFSSGIYAQHCMPEWISYPEVDSTSQIWFRQTYLSDNRPTCATVSITTTGMIELYINGYNVSTDTRIPFRNENDDSPINMTFNVTRFLRPDSNIVAVWYSPSYPHIQQKQISLCFSGIMPDGKCFSYNTNNEWLCRKANISLTDKGEEKFIAPSNDAIWNSSEYEPACWINATAYQHYVTYTPEEKSFYTSRRVTKIHHPFYHRINRDSIEYRFDTAFHGYIRVTLREAKKGEQINIDGLEYTCNGNIDEQTYRKFTDKDCSSIIVWGDRKFRRSQIQNVEGVEINTYFHAFWMY